MILKKFKEVYEKHKPNWFIVFMYRWFNVDMFKKPKPIGTWFCVMCFFAGGTNMIVFDQLGHKDLATVFSYVLMGFFLFIFTLPAYWMNQRRIKRICKELGITIEEYNIWVNLL